MQNFSVIRIALVLTIGFVWQAPVLAETDYPAAYFKPYIVYQAPEIAGNTPAGESNATAEAAATPAAADPYPAAYFQPVIVYQDKDLIAAETASPAAKPAPAPVEKPRTTAKNLQSSPVTPAPAPSGDGGGVPVGVIIGLVALVGGLYWVVFIKKDDNVEASSDQTDVPGEEAPDETDQPAVQEESA